jgi:hypothetical protein
MCGVGEKRGLQMNDYDIDPIIECEHGKDCEEELLRILREEILEECRINTTELLKEYDKVYCNFCLNPVDKCVCSDFDIDPDMGDK